MLYFELSRRPCSCALQDDCSCKEAILLFSLEKNKQNVFEQIFIVDHVADTPSCFDLQFSFFLIRLDWKAELP